MATIIQPTPTLVGKEAKEFWKKIENYETYLKEKGIFLSRKKIEKDAAFFKSLFKKEKNSDR